MEIEIKTLPVILLNDIITLDAYNEVQKVSFTHDPEYCPVCVSLPGECSLGLDKMTPKCYFALTVWKLAKQRILEQPEFRDALDFEWYPFSASFNMLRFKNCATEFLKKWKKSPIPLPQKSNTA